MKKFTLLIVSLIFLTLPANAMVLKEKVSIDEGVELVILAQKNTRYEGAAFGKPNKYNRQRFLI